jgi:hypothetical protein
LVPGEWKVLNDQIYADGVGGEVVVESTVADRALAHASMDEEDAVLGVRMPVLDLGVVLRAI